jgi:hypothetical protein
MKLNLTQAAWRKSSYSGQAGNCVEVVGVRQGARGASVRESAVGVRDSKHPGGPALVLTPQVWQAFTGRLKNGDFG